MARDRINLGRTATPAGGSYIDIVGTSAQFDGENNLVSLSVRFTLGADPTEYESTTFAPGTSMNQLRQEVRRVAKLAAEALG